MAYPFRPLKAKKLRKLSRDREDSDQFIEVTNHPIKVESPVADTRPINSPPPTLSAKFSTDKIFSQP
jgi:hypothetical protein